MQAASPHSSSCVITSERGRGDEGLRQRGRCTRWHAGGGTRKKYTRNGDPEDTKVERKGKQRIVGLPVDMDEGSLHRILLCIHYFRCRQTTWRQQYAKLTTPSPPNSPGISLKLLAKNMFWFLFVFYTISSSLSLLLWFVKPKPLMKHQIKKKAHYKSILYSCIWTKLTFHIHS